MQFHRITDCLEHYSRVSPDKPAYIFLSENLQPERKITFSELREESQKQAKCLLREVEAGDRALLVLPAGLDFVVLFFACLYAGIVAVPLPPPEQETVSTDAIRYYGGLLCSLDCHYQGDA